MRATTAIALFAAAFAPVAAMPAQAQMPRAAVQLRIQPQLQTGRGACARSFADTGCASYQNRLVQAVALVAATSPKPMSRREIADRQLDALLASVN